MEILYTFAWIFGDFINPSALQDFSFKFLSVLFEGLPFIFIGTLISGLIDVYLPANLMDRFLPKNRFFSILTCGLLGLIIPVCECTVVPVIRRLVAKGLPVGSAFAYMLAAPIVNPITLISTFTAFNGSWEMAISRMMLGYSVAVVVGVIVLYVPIEKLLRKAVINRLNFSGKGHSEPVLAGADCCDHSHSKSHSVGESKCEHSREKEHDHTCSSSGEHHEHGTGSCGHEHGHDHGHVKDDRLVSAMRVAMKDFIDVAVYFVIGVSLVTLLRDSVTAEGGWVEKVTESGELATSSFMMGLAFVLSLCSTSDAFVVATSFGEKFGRVSKMAFMVYGPMMDVKLVFLYQTLMRWRAVLVLIFLLFVLVGVFCMLWGSGYAYYLKQAAAGS